MRDIIHVASLTRAEEVAAIIEGVCVEFNVTLEELRGPSKLRRHAHPRQEAMRRLYALGYLSTSQIGAKFNRDHSTVVYALHRERMNEANRQRMRRAA